MGQGHQHHHHNHGHAHGHNHGHAHGHNHGHAHGHNDGHNDPKKGNSDPLSSIRIAFWLNFVFAIIEFAGGLWVNSLAIMSDAVHDLGDSIALLSAWILEKKSHNKSDDQFSYGYRRLSTASALMTGVILIAGALYILSQSIPRLMNPPTPRLGAMLGFAFLGVFVNGLAMYRVSKGKSLNERMITWHLFEDLLGWVMVLFGSVVMMIWNLPILDPLMAILLALWILWNVSKTLKETMKIFLQMTPHGINLKHIEKILKTVAGVANIHHTHIWSLDGESHILTTHVILADGTAESQSSEIKMQIKKLLKENFSIVEATIEIESSMEICSDPEHS